MPEKVKMPQGFDETDLRLLKNGAEKLTETLQHAERQAERLGFLATASHIDRAIASVGPDAASIVVDRYTEAVQQGGTTDG